VSLLYLDPHRFRSDFGVQPFFLPHHPSEQWLFSLPRLLQLAQWLFSLPRLLQLAQSPPEDRV